MSIVNSVTIFGNLGADPEVKTTANGTTVGKLRIATNERVKKGDDWTDHTEWHRVVCFGKTAENVSKFLRKGSQVLIHGKLRTSSWENDAGEKRFSTEIVTTEIKFTKGSEDGARRDQAPAKRDSQALNYGGDRDTSRGRSAGHQAPDDDIPF